ncbi:hypothetical protein [Algibacter pacificus]|uniref:hypothetical protein n=1 Tax=Algibacter pacificus TaxID=2599389 RepID=UPI0011C95F93|nr:hypothetical protein [Algibacter pacificus]
MKKIILATLIAVAVFGNLTLSNTDNSVSINLSQLIANAQDSSEDASNPPPVGGKRAVVHDGRRNNGAVVEGDWHRGTEFLPVEIGSSGTTIYKGTVNISVNPSAEGEVERSLNTVIEWCCMSSNTSTLCNFNSETTNLC